MTITDGREHAAQTVRNVLARTHADPASRLVLTAIALNQTERRTPGIREIARTVDLSVKRTRKAIVSLIMLGEITYKPCPLRGAYYELAHGEPS